MSWFFAGVVDCHISLSVGSLGARSYTLHFSAACSQATLIRDLEVEF